MQRARERAMKVRESQGQGVYYGRAFWEALGASSEERGRRGDAQDARGGEVRRSWVQRCDARIDGMCAWLAQQAFAIEIVVVLVIGFAGASVIALGVMALRAVARWVS